MESRMISAAMVTLTVTLTIPIMAFAQGTTDMFPLFPSAQYSYDYYYFTMSLDHGSGPCAVDSGTVTYTVLGSIDATVENRLWEVQETRHIQHYGFFFSQGYRWQYTTPYWIDSTRVDTLLEALSDQHLLTCHAFVWSFPFADLLATTDTVRGTIAVPRYPTSPSTLEVASLSLPGSNQRLTDSVWFEPNKGFVRRKKFTHTGWNAAAETSLDITLRDRSLAVDPGGPTPPASVRLSQNYPNPFNPSTIIPFAVESETMALLEVFNAVGERVATLVDGKIEAGAHEARFDGTGFPTGIYFYRLRTSAQMKTLPMILLR